MPQPHVILTATCSLDGRTDYERPDKLSNRLEEYRIQELRGRVDAILTSSGRVLKDDPEFPVRDLTGSEPAVVIVDKDAELPPEAAVTKNQSRKIILVTSKKAHKNRIKRIQQKRPDIEVMNLGEYAVNLEDTLWELHRAGIHRIILEGDRSLNMRMLDHNLVNEVYLMMAPMLLGQNEVDVFDGKLEAPIHMELDGILQYGDHVVLHYRVRSHR
jgi:riboflavin-specific deaminase-like protein